MITCGDAVRRLWEFLDAELDAHDHERVEQHLDRCRRCCGEAELTAALRDKLRSTPGPDLPPDVGAHLLGVLDDLDAQPR